MHCNFRNAIGEMNASQVFTPVEDDEELDTPNCTPSPSSAISLPPGQNALSARVVDGHTWDLCSGEHAPCIGPRICVPWNSSDVRDQCDQDDSRCICSFPPRVSDDNGVNKSGDSDDSDDSEASEGICKTSADCLSGDRCVKVVKRGLNDGKYLCVSCAYYSAGAVNVISIDDGASCMYQNVNPSSSPNTPTPSPFNVGIDPATSSNNGASSTPAVEDLSLIHI